MDPGRHKQGATSLRAENFRGAGARPRGRDRVDSKKERKLLLPPLPVRTRSDSREAPTEEEAAKEEDNSITAGDIVGSVTQEYVHTGSHTVIISATCASFGLGMMAGVMISTSSCGSSVSWNPLAAWRVLLQAQQNPVLALLVPESTKGAAMATGAIATSTAGFIGLHRKGYGKRLMNDMHSRHRVGIGSRQTRERRELQKLRDAVEEAGREELELVQRHEGRSRAAYTDMEDDSRIVYDDGGDEEDLPSSAEDDGPGWGGPRVVELANTPRPKKRIGTYGSPSLLVQKQRAPDVGRMIQPGGVGAFSPPPHKHHVVAQTNARAPMSSYITSSLLPVSPSGRPLARMPKAVTRNQPRFPVVMYKVRGGDNHTPRRRTHRPPVLSFSPVKVSADPRICRHLCFDDDDVFQ